MKKIHIIGGPGTGKSYISKIISQKLQIVFYDLDDIFWASDGGYSIKEDKEKRQEKFEKILLGESWVIEGSYYDWIENGIKRADIVVVLQLNNFLKTFRIVKRSLVRLVSRSPRKESISDFIKLLRWGWRYDKNKLPIVFEKINLHKSKFLVLKSKKEINAFLSNLQ